MPNPPEPRTAAWQPPPDPPRRQPTPADTSGPATAGLPAPQTEARLSAVLRRWHELRLQGQTPSVEELCADCPELMGAVGEHLLALEALAAHLATVSHPTSPPGSPAAPTAVPGYEMLGELGRGGMGVVYKARQAGLDRLVALKMILAGGHADAADRARFLAEARAAARLQHPGIVQVYEVGEAGGLPFFSLEFVSGGSLDRKARGTPLPAREAAALTEALARAVHYAHEHGVVHRDLKPANVLLTADGQPKVTDFGLAKRLDRADGQTQSGAVMGTPSYMAPEQAAGRAREVGPAADVYALGAVLYELLTGRPPFKAATPLDTVLQVLKEEPVPPSRFQPKVPRDLETVCLKCLQKEPARRYASAAALAEDLGRWLAGEPIHARPVGGAERLWRWCRRNPVVAGLLAAVALALLLGAAGAGWFAVEAQGHAGRADREARNARANAEAEARAKQKAQQESERARRSEFTALDHLYVARMSQASLAWRVPQVGRVRELLAATRPQRTGGHDFRGFEWHYLDRLLHSERLALRGLAGLTLAQPVAFRPRTGELAWADNVLGHDRVRVHLGSAAAGKPVRTLPGGAVLAFSADGRHLATAPGMGAKGRLRVWDADSGKELASLPGGTACAFSHDGRFLAAVIGQNQEAVRVWEWATGKEVRTLAGHGPPITSVAFSPDGRFLAAGGFVGARPQAPARRPAGKVWEAGSGKEAWVIPQANPVTALAFSPDGRRLVTAGGDRVARVWDAASGQELLALHGHGAIVSAAAYFPGGRLLATASYDQTARVWDATDGKPLRAYRGHTASLVSVAVSPDGKLLATSAADGSVKVWDATQDQEARSAVLGPGESVFCLAFGPGADRLAVGTAGTVVWDVGAWARSQDYRKPRDNLNVLGVAYSRDGRRLVSLAPDPKGQAKITVREAGGKGPRVLTAEVVASHMALRPDGRRLALATARKTTEVWDLDAGKRLFTIPGAGTSQDCLIAYSPDGKRLAVAESFLAGGKASCRVAVHQAANSRGAAVALPAVEGDRLVELAFGPDGRQLVGVGIHRAYAWDTAESRPAGGFALNALPHKAALSPDGKRLATAGEGGRLALWDVASGQQLLDLRGFSVQATALAFSPDGARLAGGGMEGDRFVLKVWDARPLPAGRP